MNVKSIIRKSLYCAVLAATALTANAKLEVNSLKVVGNAIWCDYDQDSGVMLSNAENPDIYKATVYISTNGDGFKFLTYNGWGGELCPESNDIVMESGVGYKLCKNEGPDYKFKVKEAANYDIVCDLEKEEITVTKSDYQTTPVKFTALWIVGGATPGGWIIGDGILMIQNADNPCKLTAKVYLNINSDSEFKFAITPYKDFGQDMFVCDPNNDDKMILRNNAGQNVNDANDGTVYEDNKWKITEPGIYEVEVDVEALTISYEKVADQLTVGETGYATFCPFTAIEVENLTDDIMAYKASVEGTTVKLSKMSKIAAGEGVLLRSVKGGAVTVEALLAGGEVSESDDNAFVGVTKNTTVYEAGENGATNYVLSKEDDVVGFYLAKTEADGATNVAAGKAYLPVKAAGNAKALTLVFDGETTGISEVGAQKAAADNACYTLSGVRVQQPTKGLYIVNGKKVVIR